MKYSKYLILILSVLTSVVNYDAETGGWVNLLDKLKTTVPITDECKSALGKLKNVVMDNMTSAKDLGEMVGYTDEQFFKFAKQADMSGDLLKQYEDYMKKAAKATSAFGTTLKSIGANLGIMLAITVAMQVAMAAIDAELSKIP